MEWRRTLKKCAKFICLPQCRIVPANIDNVGDVVFCSHGGVLWRDV